MLVGAYDGGVEKHFLEIGIFGERREHALPDPLSDQRPKRWYTLFQEPNSRGRSRHGAPVRAIHSTASTNRRLSAAVRPGSVIRPGNMASIRRHCSFRRTLRIAPPTLTGSWALMIALNVNRP
jgi:hypothetical protein